MTTSVNPALEVLGRYRPHIKTPFHSRLLAIAVLLVGTLLLIGLERVNNALAGNDFGALPIGWLPIAAITFTLSGRLWLRDAFQLLHRDARPPILYLRSFDHDETPGTFLDIFNSYFSWKGLDLVKKFFAAWISPEARLCPILKTMGPVITFGRQTDFLNVKTACRIKISQTVWKDLLAELMEVSALIVVDSGKSTSLLWELQRCLSEQNRRKLVIALPVGMLQHFRDGWEYMKIRGAILETLHYALPRFQDDVAFIRFNEEGGPVAQRLIKGVSLPCLLLGRTRATMVGVLKDLEKSPHPYRVRSFGFAKKTAVVGIFLFVVIFLGAYRLVEQDAQVRQFAQAEVERRKTLDGAIRDLKGGKISREQLEVILQTNILPQLKADRAQLSKLSSSLTSDKLIVANAFLRYSAAEIHGIDSLMLGLESNEQARVSAALKELSQIDTYLAGLPSVGRISATN